MAKCYKAGWFWLILVVFFPISKLNAQLVRKHNLYLIAGQGSDERIFNELSFESSRFEVIHLPYKIPLRGERLKEYSLRMIGEIDTTCPFSLIGVSLGGMICTELADTIHPENIIIISSAKKRKELPASYRVLRYLPLYAILPRSVIKAGAQVVQPLFEPDRKSHAPIFKAMLKAKNKTLMKRSIYMIVNWQRMEYDESIQHIHGDNDHTLPWKKANPTHTVKGGSHMMTLTNAAEVSTIINNILEKD